MKIPQTKPVSVSGLREAQLNAELEKGYIDMLEGNTKSADLVFAEISKEYDL